MYDERIYHLDLCIIAYHLHSQTLIWPMDPYYEQIKDISKQEKDRKTFMDLVQKNFTKPYNMFSQAAGDLIKLENITCHGPGYCMGKADQGWQLNSFLDPIISEYSNINPWQPSFTRPNKDGGKWKWILYNTPKEITDRINVVKMFSYSENNGPYAVSPTIIGNAIYWQRPSNIETEKQATDLLYCFEGGTGAIGGAKDQKKYASWSMMGFVLAREVSRTELNITANAAIPELYDIHIVFRGSRSGDLRPKEAITDEKGNPDWVTDGDFFEKVRDPEISKFGRVCRGFGTSIKTHASHYLGLFARHSSRQRRAA